MQLTPFQNLCVFSTRCVQVSMLQYSHDPDQAALRPLWSLEGPIPKSALEAHRQAGILAAAGNEMHSPISYCLHGHRQVCTSVQNVRAGVSSWVCSVVSDSAR